MKLNQLLLIFIFYVICFIFNFSKDNALVFYDVGQGDSALITYKNIKVLIDGGPNSLITPLPYFFTFLNVCDLSFLILTHNHADHANGLLNLKSFCPNSVYFDSYTHPEKLNIENATFYFLWPPPGFESANVNNESVVVLFDAGNFEALFLGDLEVSTYSLLDINKLSSLVDGRLDVLKVAHHGSKNGLDKAFISRLRPRYCVISVGKNNYGHPDSEVISFLNDLECNVLRTDFSGEIRLRF